MKKSLLTFGAVLGATPALAHHPLAGAPMETFAHGILSGAGHPVLGFDHLFFVALVGIVALFTGRKYVAPLGFIVAMLLGTLASSYGAALPGAELMIVASLLILGYVAASGRTMALVPAMALFALAGLFHGSAYGESVAAQEAGIGGQVLVGYLIGLGITQYLIAIVAGFVIERFWNATGAGAMAPRLAGAVVAGIGLFLALETVEGAAFAALGIG